MTAGLDINSARGRVAAADQLRATQIVFTRSARFTFLQTDNRDKAAADGFITRDGFIIGVAEVKSRPGLTIEKMMGEFHGEWILTNQKLLDIQTISRLLAIPGYGLVYLPDSRLVLLVDLIDKDGLIICKHREAMTTTQATCNGGLATRKNSYIDLTKAKIYREVPSV